MKSPYRTVEERMSRGAASAFGTWLLLGSLTLAGLNHPVLARQSDLEQPIDIRADRSEFDEKAGTQTLTGNVEITQGSMRITADMIAIALKDNALSTIMGTGSPIRFEQQNEAGQLMRGEAQRISYDALAGTLILEGKATLSQPKQELVSERITFNARTQKVSAEGGPTAGRVSIQIQPPTSIDQ